MLISILYILNIIFTWKIRASYANKIKVKYHISLVLIKQLFFSYKLEQFDNMDRERSKTTSSVHYTVFFISPLMIH